MESQLQERVWMRLPDGKPPAEKGMDEAVSDGKPPARKGVDEAVSGGKPTARKGVDCLLSLHDSHF